MKKQASFSHLTKETPEAHQHHDEQKSSLPSQKKPRPEPKRRERRSTATDRILRDVLNLPPLRDRGGCWPTLVTRK